MAIEVGNIFEGRVTGVKPFGAFVALPEGRVGMVHISEVSNEYVRCIAPWKAARAAAKVRRNEKRLAKKPKKSLPTPPRMLYNSNVSK